MTASEVDHVEHAGSRRGRSARQAERLAKGLESLPYLTRKLAPVEVISAEGLETIEHNADTLLEEVGIEIVNYPEAVDIFRSAGADADGMRVRFPRGLCRSLINATAPRIFTQRARNEARSVVIGDPHMVLVPTYGSPFIRSLDLHADEFAQISFVDALRWLAEACDTASMGRRCTLSRWL